MERFTEKFKDGRNILRNGIADVFHIGFGRFFEGDAVDKLAEYEDLEEQGLLKIFPCKNWMDIVFGEQETFWGIDKDCIENPIREITVDNAERLTWYDGWKTVVLKGVDENGLDWEFSPSEIGKTVFLTQAEAKEAMKAMDKQIPYKPKEAEVEVCQADRYYACKCGNMLLPIWEKYPTKLMPKSEGLPYCMECGQKLDWSK